MESAIPLPPSLSDEAQDRSSHRGYSYDNGNKRRRLLQSSADVSSAWQSVQHTSPNTAQGLSNTTADRSSTFMIQSTVTPAPPFVDSTDCLHPFCLGSGWNDAEPLQTPGRTVYSATHQPNQTQLYEVSTGDFLARGWDFDDAAYLFSRDLLEANQPPAAFESLDPEIFNFEDIVHSYDIWPVLSPTPSGQSQLSQATTRPRHEIPSERFTRIQQLWPSAIKFSEFPVNLWKHVMALEHNNIVSDSRAHSDQSPTRTHSGKTFKCGFDHLCRAHLAYDTRQFGLPVSTPELTNMEGLGSAFRIEKGSGLSSNNIRSLDLCSLEVPATFPSTELFGSSLDLYFRRFHTMMPFIHQPTFSASVTSSVVLYPMCLIGFTFLNDLEARRFVNAQLPVRSY
nr:hypothetical protein LTR18_008256 [Exophiala xenobiotica]